MRIPPTNFYYLAIFIRHSLSFHSDLIIIYDYIGNVYVAKVQTKINSEH